VAIALMDSNNIHFRLRMYWRSHLLEAVVCVIVIGILTQSYSMPAEAEGASGFAIGDDIS
jgi:hypothetical protein